MTAKLLKQTIIFLLPALLLLCPQKIWADDDEKTYWKGQLDGVSVGSTGNETDVSITSDEATDTTYTVKTAKGLAWIAMVTNSSKKKGDDEAGDNYPSAAGFKGCTVTLNNDIDLKEHYWTPIGSSLEEKNPTFQGTFDGNHKIVKGLKVDETKTKGSGNWKKDHFVGLFGELRGYIDSSGGSIRNLGIQIAAEGVKGYSTKGDSHVGGLAGYNHSGTIENCFVIGEEGRSITADKGNNEHLSNFYYCHVGGLVGRNDGTITNCYTTVNVSAKGGDNNRAGGIIGYNAGSVSNVYATGKIEATGGKSNYCGGIIGEYNSGTVTNIVALNKDGLTADTKTTYSIARIANKNIYQQMPTNYYASTQIRLNGKVKGAGIAEYIEVIDGPDIDTDFDLSTLFPTDANNGAWTIKEGKLPILKGFNSDSNNGDKPQPLLDKSAYLDAPLDIATTASTGNGTTTAYTLTYSEGSDASEGTPTTTNTSDTPANGWKYKQGEGEATSFSGRIKGTNTAATLTVSSSADYEAVLTFADKFSITSGSDAAAITVSKSSATNSISFVSEGTATVKAKAATTGGGATNGVNTSNALSVAAGTTCSFDPTNRFHIYGGITTNSNGGGDGTSGTLKGLMQWQWDAAPNSAITISWDGGSTEFTSADSYTRLATNPSGKDVTVKIGEEAQQGKKNGTTSDPLSVFNFDEESGNNFIYYTAMSGDVAKGTQANPYIIDFSNLAKNEDQENKYKNISGLSIYLTSSDGGYYILKNKTDNATPSVIIESVNKDEVTTFHLKFQNVDKIGLLQPMVNNKCYIESSINAEQIVANGDMIFDAPQEIKSSLASGYAGLSVGKIGSATVNSTIKLYITHQSDDRAPNDVCGINLGKEGGKLTINENGKVYAHGEHHGLDTLANISNQLEIKEGGLLLLASTKENAFASISDISQPSTGTHILQWDFATSPEKSITVKKDGKAVFSFLKEDFDNSLEKAKSFAAYVSSPDAYSLYADEDQYSGIRENTNDEVKEFTYSSDKSKSNKYIYVGVAMKEDDKKEDKQDKITLTSPNTYQTGTSSTESTFNNVLSNKEITTLEMGKDYDSKLLLNNVSTITNLTVSGTPTLDINGTTTIGNISASDNGCLAFEIRKNGSLTIENTSLNAIGTITNNGTFIDKTGSIPSVQILWSAMLPNENSNKYVSLSVAIDGEEEVAPNSTTTLTATSSVNAIATSSVNAIVTRSLPGYTENSSTYKWEKKNEEGTWVDIQGATSQTYNAGLGEYRCQVTETVKVGSDARTVTTALYTNSQKVTEKASSGDDDDGDDPDPVPPTPVYYTVTIPAVEGATTDPAAGSYEVESWDSFRFYLTLDAAYDRSTPVVTTDRGETIEPRTSDSAYIVKYVRSDLAILIDGIVPNTAVANEAITASDAPAVCRLGNRLCITTPSPADVRIYNFSGTLLSAHRLTTGGKHLIDAPEGACIVIVADKSFKIGR
ncbi:hypothetical protein DXD68_05420 [Parabacteroides sp. TM07-1AC]|uniref:GLUG motif-containing protein n=1 Tax=Parabacteroides sp. TM07-1AC TaxID=2292363 RepID=UPI000F0090BA|nr:GLUG motif-containing protein [Parabacteroides sp. TM07-1AC]RHU28915.1 hypothetical protein DXD68_05420 [Parabacteroides sp. TM07-1AC]